MMRCIAIFCLLVGTGVSAQTSQLRSIDTEYAAASWKAVGRIDFGRGAFCSGTLITPDLVLTAAHCLYRADNTALWPIDQIQFSAGLRDGQAVAVRRASHAAAHEKFDPNAPLTAENIAHDVALIRLKTPISTFEVPPFYVHEDVIAPGPVSVVSYGRGRADAQSRQKECQMLSRHGDAMVFDCDVTFGSSGSPVFSHLNGRGRIMAVISGVTNIEGGIVASQLSTWRTAAKRKSGEDTQQPPSRPSIGVLHDSLLPRRGRVTEPSLCTDLSLQLGPADELGATVEGNGSTCDQGQIFDRFYDLAHDRFCTLIRNLQDHCEAADPFDQ